MAIVNVNSIAGINSITAQSNSVTFYKPDGQLADVIGNFSVSVPPSAYASSSDVAGVTTSAFTISGNSSITLINSAQAANISNGFSVTGVGIAPGTRVSSGGGTSNLTLTQTAGITSARNSLTFYTNSKVISPGGVGGMLCRAWVNFDGTLAGTTPFTSSNGIRASYNVSSVTYNALATYTINFTSPLPDANYAFACSGRDFPLSANTNNIYNLAAGFTPTTTAFRVTVADSNGNGNSDTDYVCVSIFR